MSTRDPPAWVPPKDIEEFKQKDTARTQFATNHETIDNLEEQVTQLNLDLNLARAAPAPIITVPVVTFPSPITASPFRSENFTDHLVANDDPSPFPSSGMRVQGVVVVIAGAEVVVGGR
ncbi:uncharacterized protein H6S33_008844 [Morchella sextelata]|uniref:uncharacterized protein n=1 Tax=Morchella sextelata TaxID=1174677 RepID=UPI001D05B293|nr:uncharacterized protein H6S33_008844 [Morchella sextelata]KAH0612464.1 hypothetical protein H6S33_008844 [Morchella sextelata]